jgi:hypothetical protein
MPHDPARVAETKSWFEKAANDLRAADHELTAVPPLPRPTRYSASSRANVESGNASMSAVTCKGSLPG